MNLTDNVVVERHLNEAALILEAEKSNTKPFVIMRNVEWFKMKTAGGGIESITITTCGIYS